MYIDRNIDRELLTWTDSPYRKPLILRGVRQCGKTEAVRHLGGQFSNYAEINLEKTPGFILCLKKISESTRFLPALRLRAVFRSYRGKRCCFLIKYRNVHGRSPHCAISTRRSRIFISSPPVLSWNLPSTVQNAQKCSSRSEGFEVFLCSRSPFRNISTAVNLPILRKQLESAPMISDENVAHERLLEEYKNFLIVGGMPEAVSRFAGTGSLLESQRVHRDIVMNFREDFDKYDTGVSPDTIRQVFDYSFRRACGQVRSSSAISGLSAYQFNAALEQLKRAGLVVPVVASSCETLPLGAGEKESNLKILPFDTGIFLSELGLSLGDILGSELFEDLNKGNLAELATGLELIKSGDPYSEPHLYYWYRSGANAEVDYVTQVDSEIIPIEVKAAVKGGMKRLRSYLSSHPASFGIRTSLENYARYDGVRVIPLYAACRIPSMHLSMSD